MPFNAGGSTTRTTKTSGGTTWASDAAASNPINATEFDTEAADIYAMLAKCITKDGNQTVTANIPMNSFKFTALVDPTSAQDSATKNYVDTKALLLASGGAVVGNTTFGGTLGVTGATTLSGSATVGTTLGVTGATTLSGSATVGTTLGVTGVITASAGIATGANDSSGRGVAICKFKAGNTNRTNNTVTSDPDLTLAIGAAGTYEVFICMAMNGAYTPGGLNIAVAYSGTMTGAASAINAYGLLSGAQHATSLLSINNGAQAWTAPGSGLGQDTIYIVGTLTATGAGTLSLQWAQNTTNASATSVSAGSYMKVTQLS